jgi:hypothetical protein
MQWLKKLFRHGNGRHLARPADAKNQNRAEHPGAS